MSDYPFTPSDLPKGFDIDEIVLGIRQLKQYGEEPNTIIFTERTFPLRVRVKGGSKQRKRGSVHQSEGRGAD